MAVTDVRIAEDYESNENADRATQVRHKNAVIASQRTDIADLEELSDEREKELAEAHQKITLLTQAVNELTVGG
jgi:glutamate mutase epsilon subunit